MNQYVMLQEVAVVALKDFRVNTSTRVQLNLLGVEYNAAMPLRKSLAKSFPPVAEAAYGPYAATV